MLLSMGVALRRPFLLLPECRALTKPRDSFALRPESISEFRCPKRPALATTDSAIHSLGGTGCSNDLADGHWLDHMGRMFESRFMPDGRSALGLGFADDLSPVKIEA